MRSQKPQQISCHNGALHRPSITAKFSVIWEQTPKNVQRHFLVLRLVDIKDVSCSKIVELKCKALQNLSWLVYCILDGLK